MKYVSIPRGKLQVFNKVYIGEIKILENGWVTIRTKEGEILYYPPYKVFRIEVA